MNSLLYKYQYDQKTNPWVWRYAESKDIDALIQASLKYYNEESKGIYSIDIEYLRYRLDMAITLQRHNPSGGVLFVAEEGDKLLGYSWIEPSGNNFWSQEKLCEVRLAYVDSCLSTRKRMFLVVQMIDKWIKWSCAADMDLLISTTMKSDEGAFMRLHQQYGFTIRSNAAYLRIKDIK